MDQIEALKPVQMQIGDIPVIVHPPGWVVDPQVDLLQNEFQQKPAIISQIITVANNDSFAHYDELFRDTPTQYFVNRADTRVMAIFDYHEHGTPNFSAHKLIRKYKPSRECTDWFSFNNRKMGQKEFAEFLQDRIAHLSRSDRAEVSQSQLLGAILQFRATQNANCNSVTNLTNGDVKFEFTRDTQVQSATLPTQILLAIPVFEFGQQWEIPARLQYDLKEGKVTFWYQLINIDALKDEAFAAEVETLRLLISEEREDNAFFILEA
jgi:uncharacterized protein YfdQ (DUF2303 family)